MTTDRELMQLALNTLDLVTDLTSYDNEVYEAIDALHARLAQPEQEPVAWRFKIGRVNDYLVSTKKPGIVYSDGNGGTRVDKGEPLYIAAQQREWQGLTEDDIREFEIWFDDQEEKRGWNPPEDIAKYLEAKLREKNT